ncbi:MAG: hypothetical protein A2Y76_11865 [Planctomycetes bacterium RBG_13_60_9]|nr:MAG: hypothetical protein A2Y76_11865 [Planctomycetes bacterium RBG_13_60_9]
MVPYPSGHHPTIRILEDWKKAIVEREGARQTLEARRVPTPTEGNRASSSLRELPSGREPVCGVTV